MESILDTAFVFCTGDEAVLTDYSKSNPIKMQEEYQFFFNKK